MRVRLRFAKTGKVRFTSHRDVARIWERALRRAGLPIAYTEGFSPRPKMHFGLALSTGNESLAEYLDIDLRPDAAPTEALDEWLAELPSLLDAGLPAGIEVLAADTIPATGGTSLQQAVTACSWRLTILGLEPADAAGEIRRLLDAPELPVLRERKGKLTEDDIRPAVLRLTLEGAGDAGVVVAAELATQPRAVRPGELLAALSPSAQEGRVLRTHQWIDDADTGTRSEPLAPNRPLPEVPWATPAQRTPPVEVGAP
jgi:radical SAM-linked protein